MSDEEGQILLEIDADESGWVSALSNAARVLVKFAQDVDRTSSQIASTWGNTVSAVERTAQRVAIAWTNTDARIRSSEASLSAFLAAENAKRERMRMQSAQRVGEAAKTEADIEEKLAQRRALIAQEYDAKLTAIREKGAAERTRIEEEAAQKALGVQARTQAAILELSVEQMEEAEAIRARGLAEEAALLEESMARQIGVSKETAVQLQRIEAQKTTALLEAETRYQEEMSALREASLAEQVAFFKQIEEAEASMQAERNASAYRFEQEQLKYTLDRLKEQEAAEAKAQADMNAEAKALADERLRIAAKSSAEYDAMLASAHRNAQKTFAEQMAQAKAEENARQAGTRGIASGAWAVNRAADSTLFAGATVAAPLVAGAVTASDFNKSILQAVNNTTLASNKIGEFRQNVIQLMGEFPKQADEIANAQMRVLNYGFTGKQVMMVLTAATQAATAQFSDEEKTAQGLAREMSLFNIPAEDAGRFMNMLSAAARLNDMTLADWVEHAGRAYQTASTLGVNAADASAAFTTLTKSGMDSATAATAFAQILNSIVHPTHTAQEALARLSKQTGIDLVGDFTAAGLKERGFTQIMDDLSRATHGNADEIKNLMTARRGFIPLLALLVTRHQQYIDTLKTENQAWQDNNFIQQKSAEVNKQTSSQLQIFQNQLVLLANSFQGDVLPVVNQWIGYLSTAVKWLGSLSSGTKTTIVDSLAFTAAAMLLVGALEKVAAQIGFTVAAAQALSKWLGITEGAEVAAGDAAEASAAKFALSFGPGGVAFVAIAAFGTYCIYWWNQIKSAQDQATQSAKDYNNALHSGETSGSMGKRILTTIEDIKNGPGGIEATQNKIQAFKDNHSILGVFQGSDRIPDPDAPGPFGSRPVITAQDYVNRLEGRIAQLHIDESNLTDALAAYEKSPAHAADHILDTGGTQAQAIAAAAEHMKSQATLFRGHCEEFVRTAVQSVTHAYDKYYDKSAAQTMRNFQNGKVGFPYTPGTQLMPGDMVYSGKEGGANGHAVLIGANGEVVGTAPMPQRDMQWVVRPGSARGGAGNGSVWDRVFGYPNGPVPRPSDNTPMTGHSSAPDHIAPAFDSSLPSSLIPSSISTSAAQGIVAAFDKGSVIANAKDYKDVIADINETEAQYVATATKAGNEMEALQHQVAAVQRRTLAYKQAEDALKPALDEEAQKYAQLYPHYVATHDALVKIAAAQNQLTKQKAGTHKDDTGRLDEIKQKQSQLATSAEKLRQQYAELHKELTKAKAAFDSYNASLDSVKTSQDKESSNGARISERMGVLSGQADSQFLQEHMKLYNAGQESYDDLVSSLTQQGRQAAVNGGISSLTANTASLGYLLSAMQAIKNPSDQARESIKALSDIISELGSAAKKQAAASITSQGDTLAAIARDPRMTTAGKLNALTQGVGNLAQSVLGTSYSSDMSPEQVMSALQQTNMKAHNIASTTYAEIAKLRQKDDADALDSMLTQNDLQRQHFVDLARYRSLDHDQFVSYMQGLTDTLQQELATQTNLTQKQQEQIERAIAQNQQTVLVMQTKWNRQNRDRDTGKLGSTVGDSLNKALTEIITDDLEHNHKKNTSPTEVFRTMLQGILKDSVAEALKDAGSVIGDWAKMQWGKGPGKHGATVKGKPESEVQLEAASTYAQATGLFAYWVLQFVNAIHQASVPGKMGQGSGTMGSSSGTMGSGSGGKIGTSSGSMGTSGAAVENAARTAASVRAQGSGTISGIANTTSDVDQLTGMDSQNVVTQAASTVSTAGGILGDVAQATKFSQLSGALSSIMPWVGLVAAAGSLLGGLFGAPKPEATTHIGQGTYADIAGSDYTGMIDSGYSGASGMRQLLSQRQALSNVTHNWGSGAIVVNSPNSDPVAVAQTVMDQIGKKTAIANAATGSS